MNGYLTRFLDLDVRVSNRLRIAERPGPLRTIATLLAHSGDSWFWGIGLVVLAIFGSPYWRTRALVMLAAIGVGAVLVLLIKFSVRRQRPVGDWGRVYRATDPHSFPSGHATRAVMLAVLAIAMGPPWFAVIMLIWAPLVALARVSMGVHYLSDVLAGGLLGLILGLVVSWLAAPLF
ncbi:MAG: phosphatase PAP2 family protein [Anaerolineales bacterium]|jgi:undecaprenyl-diphosphatase